MISGSRCRRPAVERRVDRVDRELAALRHARPAPLAPAACRRRRPARGSSRARHSESQARSFRPALGTVPESRQARGVPVIEALGSTFFASRSVRAFQSGLSVPLRSKRGRPAQAGDRPGSLDPSLRGHDRELGEVEPIELPGIAAPQAGGGLSASVCRSPWPSILDTSKASAAGPRSQPSGFAAPARAAFSRPATRGLVGLFAEAETRQGPPPGWPRPRRLRES